MMPSPPRPSSQALNSWACWVRDVAVDHAFPEDVDTRQDYETLLRAATPLV